MRSKGISVAFTAALNRLQKAAAPAAAAALGSTQRAAWQVHVSARGFSAASGDSSGGGRSPSSPEQAVSRMVETMEAMMRDPSTQQLLLARMPPHMRRPEVVKAMLANPEVRQRIAALAQQTGLNHMMGGLQADRVIAGVDATRKAGVDPGALFSRFMSSPSLAARLKDPRVLAALADVVQHGPQALSKYSGDKEVVEAWNEAAGILEQLQRDDPQPRQQQDPQQGCCGVGGNGSGGGGQAGRGVPTPPGAQANQAEAMARAGRALGAAPEELVARAMARPELLQRVQDPEVQKALLEISQSPWKAVKYLLNPKVMGALKEVREALKEDQAKQ